MLDTSKDDDCRIGTCVECIVRDDDDSNKKVHKCNLCQRWFCKEHISPRIANIVDFTKPQPQDVQTLLDEDRKRKDGHPDFRYTRIKLNELAIEKERQNKLIRDALDGTPSYCETAEPATSLQHRSYENTETPAQHAIISEQRQDQRKDITACPKCHSPSCTKADEDDKTLVFECQSCGHKWFRQKTSPYATWDYDIGKDSGAVDQQNEGEILRKTDIVAKETATSDSMPSYVARPSPAKKYSPPNRLSYHFDYRRRSSYRTIVAALMVLIALGVFLWYIPTLISILQTLPTRNNSSDDTNSQNPSNQDSSYTKLTLMKIFSPFFNFTSLAFGDIDYSFMYYFKNSQYFLVVCNSILEEKSYAQPTNGSVYRDIGIETKVSEANSKQVVLLVKPTVQDYLASLSFEKLTIAQGQYQIVNFSRNVYSIGYFRNPPYYSNELMVATPLFESREYYITGSQIVSCDLGLEIRVYKATTAYAVIYVKPSY